MPGFKSKRWVLLGGVAAVIVTPAVVYQIRSGVAQKAAVGSVRRPDFAGMLNAFLSSGDMGRAIQIAKDPRLSHDDQMQIANVGERSVRIALASNPCLLEKLADQLSGDGDPAIRQGLALNTNLSPSIRTRLKGDRDEAVQTAANRDQPTKIDVTCNP